MKLDVLPIGLYEENIYILHHEGHVLLVDPGRFPNEILSHIEKDEIVDGIVLTHGHSDHTGAVDDLVDVFHCPVHMNLEDAPLVDQQYARSMGAENPVYSTISPLQEGNVIIGTFPLTIYFTPGHSKGSSLIQYRHLLFTGDTLFAGDIGRTDLFGGSDEEMLDSLKRIAQLDHDLTILPGHGPHSTIAQELKTNPYLFSALHHNRI